MFFLKKIFQKNLNIDEIEDLLFDNGVEPKFAYLIISKIKEEQPKTIVIECYHGVSVKLLISKLKLYFVDATVLSMTRGFKGEASIEQ